VALTGEVKVFQPSRFLPLKSETHFSAGCDFAFRSPTMATRKP
jgi:hypothetical protein